MHEGVEASEVDVQQNDFEDLWFVSGRWRDEKDVNEVKEIKPRPVAVLTISNTLPLKSFNEKSFPLRVLTW